MKLDQFMKYLTGGGGGGGGTEALVFTLPLNTPCMERMYRSIAITISNGAGRDGS